MYACRICLSNSDLIDIFQFGENIASDIMLFASVQVNYQTNKLYFLIVYKF